MNTSKAIILAAGRGTRIKKLCSNKPKCLLKNPLDQNSILIRQINILKKHKINDIVIISGYKSHLIKKEVSKFKGVKVKYYPKYKLTNNLNTLLYFKKEIISNFVCLFSDVIFDEKILSNLLKKKKDVVAVVDTKKVLKNTMRVKINRSHLTGIGSHITIKSGDGNFIGICKFSKKAGLKLKKNLIKLKNRYKDYYTIAIQKMIDDKSIVNFIDCKKLFWKEIDTTQDYKQLLKKYEK